MQKMKEQLFYLRELKEKYSCLSKSVEGLEDRFKNLLEWDKSEQKVQALNQKAFDMIKDEPLEMQVSLALGSDITWSQDN